jgi:hypothetical protein
MPRTRKLSREWRIYRQHGRTTATVSSIQGQQTTIADTDNLHTGSVVKGKFADKSANVREMHRSNLDGWWYIHVHVSSRSALWLVKDH